MITSRTRQRLQDRSPDLYARFHVIELNAHPLLEYAHGGSHIKYTTHGISHVSAVEQNYDWLLADEDLQDFATMELFCLLCATLFHDALMLPRRTGDESQARANHIQRARQFLHLNREALTLSVHEAEAIAEVIRGPGVQDISDLDDQRVIGNVLVHLRKLGACLSIADIAHADSSRAPEIVFKYLDLDEESAYHWRRHLQISGITRVDNVILMSALTFSEAGDTAVSNYRDSVNQQLKAVRPYFDTVLSPLKDVRLDLKRLESPLEQTLRFQTNTPAILKLLVEGVYDRNDVFVRELVQNSLDACTIRRAKLQKRAKYNYEPQIVLTIYSVADGCRAFRVDDNGAGMDFTDVQDTLLWIGSSVCTNAEVAALLQETTRQKLIATFGIGLLSCFKVSRRIDIRTAKERATPLQLGLTGISDNIVPEKCGDLLIGTTMIVYLEEEETYLFTASDLACLGSPWGSGND